ncbi:hypothetical protein Dsin_030682 [Dipteronia sinensis]|uniref:VQ domain-containing protein n=1 Tax=Dipteronia sinensis TaxID=43782 RepID=A0AAD9ZJK2_9ROSI|nr:hypothetical protein Dsin_030682 [Dipteronia sinensis]
MKRKAVSRVSCVKEVGKDENCSKKQQLNHLIKVLRPKVYITDTSNFKSLVQQLTGNINATSSSSLSPPSSQSSPLDRTEVVLHVEDDHHHIQGGDHVDHQLPQQSNNNYRAEEANSSSFEASVDNDSFDQLCDINVNMLSSLEAENYNRVQLNDISSSSSMNEQCSSWDWLAYQEIESWLIDDVHVDHHRHNYQQEVSVYDYELFSWANMN